MLHLDLKLPPKIEKKFIAIVNDQFSGSYEKFIESAVKKRENVLSKLIDISEDLGIEDLAENHDYYLYGNKKWESSKLKRLLQTINILNNMVLKFYLKNNYYHILVHNYFLSLIILTQIILTF